MALVTTILTVVAILGGISLLLWVSTVMESRHLGPLVVGGPDGNAPEPSDGPALSVVDPVQTAA